MQDRSDRSLANTYPFHLGEKEVNTKNYCSMIWYEQYFQNSPGQSSRHTASSSIMTPSIGHQEHVQLGNREDIIPAPRSSPIPATSHRSSLFQSPAAQTYYQAQSGLPASSFHLNLQTHSQAQPGFTLLSGFGSRTNPTSQYQIGSGLAYAQNNIAAASSYQAAPSYQASPSYEAASSQIPSLTQLGNFPQATDPVAYASQGYQQAQEVPTISVHNAAVTSQVPKQCPAPQSISPQECQGSVNACWSVGVNDVDCPDYSLCW